MARARGAAILTNDFNLNRVADLQSVRVLNINSLANALKPALLPGDTLRIKIITEGKEQGQGVGYLDDGTMVVIEGGARLVDQELDILVTRVLQTVMGRMVFAPDAPGVSAPGDRLPAAIGDRRGHRRRRRGEPSYGRRRQARGRPGGPVGAALVGRGARRRPASSASSSSARRPASPRSPPRNGSRIRSWRWSPAASGARTRWRQALRRCSDSTPGDAHAGAGRR